MRASLRNKIIAWSFVPTTIILVTVTLVSLYAYQRLTENLVIERDREMTRLAANLLANELSTYTDPLSDQFLAVFDGMIAYSANGTILASEPELYERWTPRWFHDISLHQAIQSLEPAFSDVVTDPYTNEQLVIVVMPLRSDSGESMGGIAGIFRLDANRESTLYRSIEPLRRGDSRSIYLVDAMGQVIYHSNPEYIGADFAALTAVDMVRKGWIGSYRTKNLTGEEIVASFAPVGDTSWGLISEETWDSLTASTRHYSKLLGLLLCLGVALPSCIATIGVRRITQPISQLIHAAGEVAGGRFGQRIEANTGDEVEQLAGQFNLMAEQLQESYAHLEQKVADRTKELAALNAIAAEVSQSLDLREILKNALDEVLEVMDLEIGQAYHLETETGILASQASRGLSDDLAARTARLPLLHSVAGQAGSKGHPVIMAAADYPNDNIRAILLSEGWQMIISIPLMVHRRAVGAINLGSREVRDITAEEMALMAAIGHQIGVAVENARLYEQAQQLAVVKERNRLARDLHDSVTQALYGVALYSEAASRQLQAGQTALAVEHLTEIRNTAQESLREMRLLIFELRLPMLKQNGLNAALQTRLEAVEGRLGLQTRFRSDLEGRLPAPVEEGLYRISQEALNNVLRHAKAKLVRVCLHQNQESITMEIEDDGVGFCPTADADQGGFGLRGMRERAARLGGALTIESQAGQGTTIRVEVSL